VTIGHVKIRIIHGHQVNPWDDLEALAAVQRKLDCNVLIHGHTHEYGVQQYDGKYFINPGNAAGFYSALNSNVTPSFIPMAN
jgi:vacuolar protein sorting-associated protein 29